MIHAKYWLFFSYRYLAPIFVGLVFIFVIVTIGTIVFCITSRSYTKHVNTNDSGEEGPDDVSNENIEDVGNLGEVVEKISNENLENVEFKKKTKDLVDACSEAVRKRHDSQPNTKNENSQQANDRIKRVETGLKRLKENPKLSDNAKILQDKWFRRNRSKVYLYLVPLISIFYFIPSIQVI